jgi:phosphoglycolate phosphatase
MIKAIIFDLDGTLVDSYPGIHQSLNEMLRALNFPEVDLETVKRRVGRGVLNLMQSSVPKELVPEALEIFRESYDRTHLSGTVLLPGVVDALAELKKRGIALALASNKPVEFTHNILKHLKIDSFFLVYSGPDGEIKPKPDPSMLKSILKKLYADATVALYVGDMMLDAETARNAGVRFALIATGGHTREELKSVKPDYLLNRLKELVEITKSENSQHST